MFAHRADVGLALTGDEARTLAELEEQFNARRVRPSLPRRRTTVARQLWRPLLATLLLLAADATLLALAPPTWSPWLVVAALATYPLVLVPLPCLGLVRGLRNRYDGRQHDRL